MLNFNTQSIATRSVCFRISTTSPKSELASFSFPVVSPITLAPKMPAPTASPTPAALPSVPAILSVLMVSSEVITWPKTNSIGPTAAVTAIAPAAMLSNSGLVSWSFMANCVPCSSSGVSVLSSGVKPVASNCPAASFVRASVSGQVLSISSAAAFVAPILLSTRSSAPARSPPDCFIAASKSSLAILNVRSILPSSSPPLATPMASASAAPAAPNSGLSTAIRSAMLAYRSSSAVLPFSAGRSVVAIFSISLNGIPAAAAFLRSCSV